MRLGWIIQRLTPLVLVMSALWMPAHSAAQSFDLDRGREPVASLDGLWRFHPGDSPMDPAPGAPLWAAPGFDDSGWPLLRERQSPGPRRATRGMSGYGWYRFTVKIPAGEKPTSLLLAPIMTSFEVYVDGKLAGGFGPDASRVDSLRRISYHLFPLTAGGSAPARTVQVAIRVWHAPIWASYVGGGPLTLGGHLAGDPELLAVEQQHRR